MPRHPHLPFSAGPVPGKITGPVIDSIAIYPWSHGILRMDGEYSISQPAPRHDVRISATSSDRCETEPLLPASPGSYQCAYRVRNYNDSPAFADLVLTAETEQDSSGT